MTTIIINEKNNYLYLIERLQAFELFLNHKEAKQHISNIEMFERAGGFNGEMIKMFYRFTGDLLKDIQLNFFPNVKYEQFITHKHIDFTIERAAFQSDKSVSLSDIVVLNERCENLIEGMML